MATAGVLVEGRSPRLPRAGRLRSWHRRQAVEAGRRVRRRRRDSPRRSARRAALRGRPSARRPGRSHGESTSGQGRPSTHGSHSTSTRAQRGRRGRAHGAIGSATASSTPEAASLGPALLLLRLWQNRARARAALRFGRLNRRSPPGAPFSCAHQRRSSLTSARPSSFGLPSSRPFLTGILR